MFKLISQRSLPCACSPSYRGLAWDGCRFYLTIAGQRAVQPLDARLLPGERIETCRPYSALCFDSKERCFWAASDECPAVLFRLDAQFRETDCLRLRDCGPGVVAGVSFQCCENRLLVAFADRTALVEKDGGLVRCTRSTRWILGALSLCPYTLVWSTAEGKTLVRLTDCRGQTQSECRLPRSVCVEAAVFDPCAGGCRFYALARRHGCRPVLLECMLEDEGVCASLCPCNWALCRCPPRPEEPCGCGDVLESIALTEAALAHILNAEGEKLQKIISCTCDPQTLLAFNESVNVTLVNATCLEQVLVRKLEALKGLCPQGCGAETEIRKDSSQ